MSTSASDESFYDAQSDLSSDELERVPFHPPTACPTTAIKEDSDDAEVIIAQISRHQSEADFTGLLPIRSRTNSSGQRTQSTGSKLTRVDSLPRDAFEAPVFSEATSHIDTEQPESPPPVAPPRRRRGKKADGEDGSSITVAPHSTNGSPPPDHAQQDLNGSDYSSRLSYYQPPQAQQQQSQPLQQSQPQSQSQSQQHLQLPPQQQHLQQQQQQQPPQKSGSPTKSGSPPRVVGKKIPSDEEVLQSTMIKCLDTGQAVPLSEAERLVQMNPLSLQIMARNNDAYDGASKDEQASAATSSKKKLRQFFEKSSKKDKDRDKKKSFTEDKDKNSLMEVDGGVKITSSSKDCPVAVKRVQIAQQLIPTLGEGMPPAPVWTMKFTNCGRLLATAGQDQIVRVWVRKDAYDTFKRMRQDPFPAEKQRMTSDSPGDVFLPVPFSEYRGHTADVLDLSWSHTGNYFLLSSSMDKTVRLWHISRDECLLCFMHEDFVTAIAFHPKNDKYFLSGSLDSKLRLWNIPEKRVFLWNEVSGGAMITAANFCRDGQYAVAGTYDGRCIFFNTEDRLKYHTHIHVQSSRGRNAKGEKISGIEVLPGDDKILVTSNDSRVRLYNLKDHSLACKYKGLVNTRSQIRAIFSSDGRYIICGSENHNVYVWCTEPPAPSSKKGFRRDRNEEYQYFNVHSAVVTATVISPTDPTLLVTADHDGIIKVLQCQFSSA
eukprot:m.109738 g.109738  ORF g.109738 m.109738 type:complete len:714 (-) comp15900_c0_seq2:301-2442(-)